MSVCEQVAGVGELGVQVDCRAAEPSRRLIVGVVIAGFCAFLQLYSVQPLLAMFRGVFGASDAAVSLTVSVATIGVAMASPFLGLVADAVGRKRVLAPCLFVIASTTLMEATAQDLHQMLIWRFVGGLATPGVVAVAMAYISEEAPAGCTGRVMAAYVAGTVLGGLTGRIASAMAAQYLNWRWSFAIVGGLTLAGAIATVALLPRSTRFRPQKDMLAPLRAMKGHLGNPRLLATYFAGFNSLLCHVGLFTYVNLYLAGKPYSLSTAALGWVFLVYALGVVVTPMSGRVVDRLGHRAGLLIAAGTVSVGAILTLIPQLAMIVLGLAVASTGVFIAQATSSSHIGHVTRGSKSAAAGLYVAAYYLGGSLGATGLSYPWHERGWPAVILSLLVAQAISAILAWRFFSTGRCEGGTAEPATVAG